MANQAQQQHRNKDFNGAGMTEVALIELLNDAVQPNQVPNLGQVQQVAGDAAQIIIIQDTSQASTDNVYSAIATNSLLSAKQDNLSIHSSSVAYAELVNGSELKITTLTTNQVYTSPSSVDLTSCLATGTFDGNNNSWTFTDAQGNPVVIQVGDTVILAASTSAADRAWVHVGSGNGDETDFIRISADYDQAAIRAMISGGNFIDYSNASGIISVDVGVLGTQLGAQTLPVPTGTFSVIVPSDNKTSTALSALETYIQNVDQNGANGTATLSQRIDALIGVTGNNLGVFTHGLFPPNEDVKDVLQAAETLIKNNQEAINAETLARQSEDNSLQQQINAEAETRAAADLQNSNAINVEIDRAKAAEQLNAAAISTETNEREAADNIINGKLDIIQGDSSTNGSIEKALQDAKDYANAQDNVVREESVARDNVLQSQITALQSKNEYKGYIGADGRIVSINPSDANNNVLFQNASFEKGDIYRVNADITITFNDTSQIQAFGGDQILSILDMPSGTAAAAGFQLWDNSESADLIRIGNIDEETLTYDVDQKVKIKDDGVGTDQLADSIVSDIDDSFKKSVNNQSISADRTLNHIIDTTTNPSFNMYLKRTSSNNAASTGTQRVLLMEHSTKTVGTGNPALPSIADVITASMTYDGDCQDGSVLITAANFEANGKVGTNVLASGAFGRADQPHDGFNAGITGQAENAGISNVGGFFYSKVGGVGNDRGVFGAISNLASIEAYAVYRAVNPIPYTDAAGVFDADANLVGPNSKAIVANGDSIFYGGVVEVPSATVDNSAVNLGDIKASAKIFNNQTIDINNGLTLTHSLGSEDLIVQVTQNGRVLQDLQIDITSNQVYLGIQFGGNLTGCKVIIKKILS